MTQVTIYNKSDIKKSGGFKKKNNVKIMDKEEFISYVKDNDLTLSKGYIDITGFISDGSRFRCSYKGIVVGVTGIMKEVNLK